MDDDAADWTSFLARWAGIHGRVSVTSAQLCEMQHDQRWGGSGFGASARARVDDVPWHGRRYSVEITLPPLSALVLVPSRLAGAVTSS